MRLIDADAFEKFIEEKYKDGESTDDIKDQMLFDLSYQPTAYDVEKVVEQLEEVTIKHKESVEFFNECGIKFLTKGKAIEIVRNGGRW